MHKVKSSHWKLFPLSWGNISQTSGKQFPIVTSTPVTIILYNGLWRVCVCCRGRVLSEWGFTWEMRWGFQLQTTSSAATAARKRKLSLTPSSALNVNMGISVDYNATSGQFESPLQCASEARRHVLGSSEHQQARKISRVAVPTTQPPMSVPSQCVADCSYDSFDDCLQAADHMDAVLAYYYADEKESGAVKVVEIFPIHRHRHPVSDRPHPTTVTMPTNDSLLSI